MSIPRKGSRQIVVDGKTYRYLIKSAAILGGPDDGDPELSITIQEDVPKAGNVVQFRTGGRGAAVLPRDIAHNIRRAYIRGWNPANKGDAFTKTSWQWAER